MAATTVTFTTTENANPIVMKNQAAAGTIKGAAATVEVAATSLNEPDDRVMILSIPSNARLVDLIVFNDDLDSDGTPALTMDIGLFYGGGQRVSGVVKAAGDVIDDDALATVITTMQAANTAGVRVLFEAQDIANVGKPLWEMGGLSSDPGGNILIGTSVGTAAATAAAGTVTLVAKYV